MQFSNRRMGTFLPDRTNPKWIPFPSLLVMTDKLAFVLSFPSSVKVQSPTDLWLTNRQTNTDVQAKSILLFLQISYLRVHKLCSVLLSLMSSKTSLPSVFPPCLQPQNKPKQNYQRRHGLGAKCWMCWIERFEVYRALRQKCHHWNLILTLTPSSPQLHSTALSPLSLLWTKFANCCMSVGSGDQATRQTK